MRKSEIDDFCAKWCYAPHDHICFNYLVARWPTFVCVCHVSFRAARRKKMPSWTKNVANFSEFVLFRNTACMFTQKCGIAGNKVKCGISQMFAGRLTPMLSRDLSGASHMLCCCRWMPCTCSRRARQRTGHGNYSRRRYGRVAE